MRIHPADDCFEIIDRVDVDLKVKICHHNPKAQWFASWGRFSVGQGSCGGSPAVVDR